jgi:hypothetical protein
MPATYEPIATTTLGAAASNITLSSIPGTYTDLRIIVRAMNDPAGGSNDNLVMQFNNDTSGLYSRIWLQGSGTAASSSTGSPGAGNYCTFSIVNLQQTQWSSFTIDVFRYAGSTFKTVLNTANQDFNGTGAVASIVNLYRSTTAVTSLKLFCNGGANFAVGTTATLYGIKVA